MKSAIRIPQSAIPKGFTLMEILIVVTIIIILAAIGIGVGHKLTSAADIEQTKANMAIIMNAMEDYYDQTGSYPGYINTGSGSDDVFELRIQRLDSGSVLASYTRFVSKLNNIAGNNVARRPDDDATEYDIFRFMGPDGQVIQYFPAGALGGRPLLIAPGEDGLYGTDAENQDDREAWGKDDLRSDK